MDRKHHSIADNSQSLETPVATFLDGSDQYVVDCLKDLSQIKDNADQWRELEQKSREGFIYFQSYDWCYNWAKIYASDDQDGSRLRVFTLKKNNILVAVWPMMITKDVPGITSLSFLTEPHGQYGNIIYDFDSVSVRIGQLFWKQIKSNAKVDAITLDQYPYASLLRGILDDCGVVEKSDKHASILDLSKYGSLDEYRATLERKVRKQRNQRRNKLARQGELSYDVYFGGTPEYEKMLDLALEWKQVWLRETGRRATVLSQETTRDFLSNLPGTICDENGIPSGVNLGVLKIGGQPIGIEIGMCMKGHYYSYLGAFDWEWRKYSPGKTQIEEAQNWALEAGISIFDFLGDPADYKNAWTDTTNAMQSRSIPLSIRGYAYCVIWKSYLRPKARKFFNQLDSDKRAKLLRLLGIEKRADNIPTSKEIKPGVLPTSTVKLNNQ